MENYEQKHPILQKLEEYFKNTPKEQIDKDWSNILKATNSEAYYEKKYQNALGKVKWLLKDQEMALHAREKLANIFPELKESEGEKTRKEILNVFKQLDEGTTICGRNYDYAKWIAWHEKQSMALNPDKVIEWLECKAFQGWAEEINIKQIVNKFIKDFEI